jgi:hypothetical protein
LKITDEAIEFTAAEAAKLMRRLSAASVGSLLLLLAGVGTSFTPWATGGRVLSVISLGLVVLTIAPLMLLRLTAARSPSTR